MLHQSPDRKSKRVGPGRKGAAGSPPADLGGNQVEVPQSPGVTGEGGRHDPRFSRPQAEEGSGEGEKQPEEFSKTAALPLGERAGKPGRRRSLQAGLRGKLPGWDPEEPRALSRPPPPGAGTGSAELCSLHSILPSCRPGSEPVAASAVFTQGASGVPVSGLLLPAPHALGRLVPGEFPLA